MTSADIFDALAAATSAGSIAILVVLALRAPLRRWLGAHTAYLLWSLVPLAVAATALPPPRAPAMLIRIVPAVPDAADIVEHAVTSSFDARPWALATWMLGVLAMAALTVAQQRRYLRGLGRLTPVDDAPGASTLRAEATTGCPALVGAWRPRIVVPRDFDTRYAPRERELVLAHERLHSARGDAQANALVVVARCLNWFNPLVHIAAARFRFDQELACDAAVVRRFPEARRCYADAMLKTQLAEQSRQELRLPVGCLWPSGHPLKERIFMLKKPVPTRTRRAIGSAVIMSLGLGGGYASWAAQPASDRIAGADAPASEDVSFRQMMPPHYPQGAVDARVSGKVVLKVHVTEDGAPESAAVANVDPPEAGVLSDAAIATVMRWRFNPALRNGVAMAGDILVPITFEINDDDTVGSEAPPPSKPIGHTPETAGVSYRRLTPPNYPVSALNNNVEGIVYVATDVNGVGRVTSATVDHVEPPIATVLGRAATTAVESWQFNAPATGGHAIVPLRFSVNSADAIQPSVMPSDALEMIDVVGKPAG